MWRSQDAQTFGVPDHWEATLAISQQALEKRLRPAQHIKSLGTNSENGHSVKMDGNPASLPAVDDSQVLIAQPSVVNVSAPVF